MDLLRKMLEKDPKKRVTAVEALTHKVFEDNPQIVTEGEEKGNLSRSGSIVEYLFFLFKISVKQFEFKAQEERFCNFNEQRFLCVYGYEACSICEDS